MEDLASELGAMDFCLSLCVCRCLDKINLAALDSPVEREYDYEYDAMQGSSRYSG